MSLAMSPHFHGVYVNNLGQEGGNRVRDAYGINYDHLASIKAAYDPDNLFRLNQNIQPQLTCPPGGWRAPLRADLPYGERCRETFVARCSAHKVGV